MMKKLFFPVLFLLLFSVKIFSQNPFNFEYDVAQFRGDSVYTDVEFYYSISDSGFTKIFSQNGIFVYPRLDILVSIPKDSSVAFFKPYVIRYKILDTNAVHMFLGKIDIPLKPGNYLLQVFLSDYHDSTKMLPYYHDLLVRDFNKNIGMSDIEIASKIVSDSKNKVSIFYKNGMEVYPNPRQVIYETMPVVYYYTEIYNAKGQNLMLDVKMLNSLGKETYKKEIPVHGVANAIVKVGAAFLKKAASGKYDLVFTLRNQKGAIIDRQSKDFYYVSSVIADSNYQITDEKVNQDFLSSRFAILSGPQCDDLFNISKYIATEQEIDMYYKLTDTKQKQKYLFSFWRKRDPDLTTRENEYLNEYLERAKFANKRFKEYRKKGVNTDRGRIYLKYGKPDKIERKQNDYYNKPYIVWEYYNIEGGVYFIFADVNGLGNYELLNSTKRGERHDPNWMNRIKVR